MRDDRPAVAAAPLPTTSRVGSRRVVLGLVRVALAVVPFLWLSRRLAWQSVLHELGHVSPVSLLIAAACSWVALLAGTLRWIFLLRAYGSGPVPRYAAMVGHNLVGAYFNVLPLGIAGDAVRGYRLRAESGGLARAYYVLLVERVCGLAGLFGLGLLVWLVPAGAHSPRGALWGAISALGLLALALGVVLAVALVRASDRVTRVAPWLGRWLGVLRRMLTPHRLAPIAGALALSLVTQGVTIAGWLALVRSLSPGVQLTQTAAALIGVVLLTFVPITPAALGQREMVTTYQLAPVGVAPTAAVTSSLLWLAVSMTLAAGGGCVYLVELWLRRGVPSSTDASS